MITHMNAKAETALRDALVSVARLEEQVESALAPLDDQEYAEALGLALLITGYVAVDACGNQWPTPSSIRRIANALSTKGDAPKRFQLDAAKVEDYLSRAVFGSERLEDVLPGNPEFTRLPIIIAKQALVVYSPKGMDVWDYLDRIESAIEAAWALEPTVLAAAVLRSYMAPSKSGAKAPSA
jgi:hypothetical protein